MSNLYNFWYCKSVGLATYNPLSSLHLTNSLTRLIPVSKGNSVFCNRKRFNCFRPLNGICSIPKHILKTEWKLTDLLSILLPTIKCTELSEKFPDVSIECLRQTEELLCMSVQSETKRRSHIIKSGGWHSSPQYILSLCNWNSYLMLVLSVAYNLWVDSNYDFHI